MTITTPTDEDTALMRAAWRALEALAARGHSEAATALLALSGRFKGPGRPPLDDAAALTTIGRLGYSRDAVAIAARNAPGKRVTVERRLRGKRKAALEQST